MRDCPNCSNPVQDEAVYCRHCRTELEPPLWLASMRRCPHCAEWTEIDAERCRHCDRAVPASDAEHTSPFVETSPPGDFTQELRRNLLDESAPAEASFSDMVEGDPIAFDDADLISDLDPDPMEYEQVEPGGNHEPEPTPFREPAPSASEPEQGDRTVAAAGSSIWMAGSAEDPKTVELPKIATGTGPLRSDPQESVFEERATSGSEGIGELRAVVSGPPGRARRMVGTTLRAVVAIVVLAGAIWGLFALWQGPAGAFVTEVLATDVPTATPTAEPTATRRPAPTLPPVTEEPAILPTELESSVPDCVLWDSVTLEDEGAELCVYGVLKRWFAGADIPFVAIFSEDPGTFAIIDRTTTHPVGPGDCILARGTVEIMRATRPDIDVAGNLEACPPGS